MCPRLTCYKKEEAVSVEMELAGEHGGSQGTSRSKLAVALFV